MRGQRSVRRKIFHPKEDAATTQKVKAETPFSVRLYAESDGKVRHRAEREGVSVAQVISDVVDEYYRQAELLPDDSERREEGIAELRRLQQTVDKLCDELHAQRLLIESQLVQINDRLHLQAHSLHVNDLLGNAQYKLLGLIFERQIMVRQMLLQYLVDPHLKGPGAEADIHQILERTHSPDNHYCIGTKAFSQVADCAAQQERIRICLELLNEGVAPEKDSQASVSTAENLSSVPQCTDQDEAQLQSKPHSETKLETYLIPVKE